MTRSQKAIIATVATVLWLGYMAVGLAVIDALAPTFEGRGPHGAAAFVGLVTGFFTMCTIMWAASD